jgi:hypothetical protein
MSILKGMTPPVKVRVCRIEEVAKGLGKEDAEILRNAVVDPAWSVNALITALSARGVSLSRTSLERHRGKRCPCSKI